MPHYLQKLAEIYKRWKDLGQPVLKQTPSYIFIRMLCNLMHI